MSSRHLAPLMTSLLVACGAPPPNTALERSSAPVAEIPATTAEQAEAQECRREWPSDPSDPRAGFYVFEHALNDHYSAASTSFYRFDGVSLTTVWYGTTNLPLDCTYGHVDDIPPRSVQTFHAHVADDGYLFALVPCFGWKQIGHFVSDDRFQDLLFAQLRRVGAEERGAIYADPDPETVDLFFECREPYEASGAPIPPPPE